MRTLTPQQIELLEIASAPVAQLEYCASQFDVELLLELRLVVVESLVQVGDLTGLHVVATPSGVTELRLQRLARLGSS